jgi:hypothetical protein
MFMIFDYIMLYVYGTINLALALRVRAKKVASTAFELKDRVKT